MHGNMTKHRVLTDDDVEFACVCRGQIVPANDDVTGWAGHLDNKHEGDEGQH